MGTPHLKIGELAQRVGLRAKTIRFYEARGILAPTARGENRYRLYAAEAVDVLRFIKQAQRLGLSLREIKEIVAIRRGGRPPCVHVKRLLEAKAGELDQKLEDLLRLRRTLRQSLRAWSRRPSRPAAVCPHIERVAVRGPSAGAPSRRKKGASHG